MLSKCCPTIAKNNNKLWLSVLFTIYCGILFWTKLGFSVSNPSANDIKFSYQLDTVVFVDGNLSSPLCGQDIEEEVYKNVSNPSKLFINWFFFNNCLSLSFEAATDWLYALFIDADVYKFSYVSINWTLYAKLSTLSFAELKWTKLSHKYDVPFVYSIFNGVVSIKDALKYVLTNVEELDTDADNIKLSNDS